MKSQPRSLQFLRESDRLLEIPSASEPNRLPRCARRAASLFGHTARTALEKFEREAHAVFERTAVRVGARIRQRRKKFVSEIAVREVQFDQRRCRAARSASLRRQNRRESFAARLRRARWGPASRRKAAPTARRSDTRGSAGSGPPPSHGTSVEPLRPAWASCTPILLRVHVRMNATTRAIAAFVLVRIQPEIPGP